MDNGVTTTTYMSDTEDSVKSVHDPGNRPTSFTYDHRYRRPNVALNLALTRNALLAIIPFDEKHNLPTLIADYQNHPSRAINLILKASPIQ
jgi:hypothetical protein